MITEDGLKVSVVSVGDGYEEFGYTLKCVNQAESHRLNAHLNLS